MSTEMVKWPIPAWRCRHAGMGVHSLAEMGHAGIFGPIYFYFFIYFNGKARPRGKVNGN